MTVDVTVVICTYNRYDVLPSAIGSLTRQTAPATSFEVIVVDNSPSELKSQQNSKQFVGIPNLQWVYEATPGLSNARNVGLSLAKGEIVAYIDDDAIAEPDWIEELQAAFSVSGPTTVCVGGKVEPIWSVPRPSWLHDDLLGYVSVVDWVADGPRLLGTKEWVAGTNISFLVKPLREIGGFSTTLGRKGGGQVLLSNEETEVTEKMQANGGTVIYAPGVIVHHLVEPGRLKQEWFRRRVAWQANSDYLKEPTAAFDRARSHWSDVTSFFSQLPPTHRNPNGFLVELDDPRLFKAQLSAIYNFMTCILAGFHGIEAPGLLR